MFLDKGAHDGFVISLQEKGFVIAADIKVAAAADELQRALEDQPMYIVCETRLLFAAPKEPVVSGYPRVLARKMQALLDQANGDTTMSVDREFSTDMEGNLHLGEMRYGGTIGFANPSEEVLVIDESAGDLLRSLSLSVTETTMLRRKAHLRLYPNVSLAYIMAGYEEARLSNPSLRLPDLELLREQITKTQIQALWRGRNPFNERNVPLYALKAFVSDVSK